MYVPVLLLATVLGHAYAGLPMNCRSVVVPAAKTPLACVLITRTQLGAGGLELDNANWGTAGQLSTDSDTTDNTYNDLMMPWLKQPSASQGFQGNPSVADSMTALNPDLLPGACRWDLERSNRLGSDEACLCPATESTCTLGRKGCYWYDMPAGSLDITTFACINSAERFYHLLSKLLKKRGKKDFAIKIRYGATPARGQLPLGPYGPAIIGGGSHSKMQLALQQLQMRQMGRYQQGFGGQSPYGHSQAHLGQSPFGHPQHPSIPNQPSPLGPYGPYTPYKK